MKPTIGRIVIYKIAGWSSIPSVAEFSNNGASECPAIVVRVFDDGKVNLRVFQDAEHAPVWRTSVLEGTEPGTWHWPPRA